MVMSYRIAVDAMGGDAGITATIPACVQSLQRHQDLHIRLYGDSSALSAALPALDKDVGERLQICDAATLASADNNARGVLRRGSESSLYRALASQAADDTQACVSAGDTGALLAAGKKLLGMLPGCHRPAICKLFPHPERPSFLLDLGATVDASAEQLLEFALLADCLARALKGFDSAGPTIRLLSNGIEAGKGSAVVKQAADVFAARAEMNFAGMIEADQLFAGVADIIVCDGFNGNIALKSAEGAVERLFDFMALQQGAEPLPESLQAARAQWAPQQLNGALLLGIDGLLVKSHGGADSNAFASAIEEAYDLLCADVVVKLRNALASD